MTQKIGLCMIAKNEESVISRCLDSVKPLIDFVLVSDTGSTDNTVSVVKDWLRRNKIPGKIEQERWINFAYNRTKALESVRQNTKIDYVLVIDADEILEYDKSFNPSYFKSSLKADLYDVTCRYGTIEYAKTSIFKNSKRFFYKSVLHEYLDCLDTINSHEIAAGIYNKPLQDSFRNKDPQKYEKDAALLEHYLKTETDLNLIRRYTFYLAQSYKDCKNIEKAILNYRKRIAMDGWPEEVWYSYHMLVVLSLQKGEIQTAEEFALKGFIFHPKRSESFYALTRYFREKNQFEKAHVYYLLGKSIKPIGERLFVEKDVYDHGFDFELSIINYYLKNSNKEEGKNACLRVLASNADDIIKRVAKNNLSFYEKV